MSLKQHTVISFLEESNTTVITANNRLARDLITAYTESKSQSVLPQPRCLPYRIFLQQLFFALQDKAPLEIFPLLLTNDQLYFLSAKIMADLTDSIPNQTLVETLIEGWQHCRQWQINLNNVCFLQNAQTQFFQTWARRLEQVLNKLNAITDYHLVEHLCKKNYPLPSGKVVWYCFDDYSPEQHAFQAWLQAQGIQIFHEDFYESFDNEDRQNLAYNYIAKDEHDELFMLIDWLQAQLNQGKQKLGVVIPDLTTQAASIERFLKKNLPEGSFSISLGKTLNDYPLVSHAYTWLRLNAEHVTNQELKLLFHSPYLTGSKAEFLARAKALQETPFMENELIRWEPLIQSLKTACPILADLLIKLQPYPQKASPHEWARLFANRLELVGFPGEYEFHSSTLQCYQRFLTVFDEFKQLQLISPILTTNEALSHFKRLVQTIIFQPKVQQTPIRILGLLEAAGCLFEGLWISGLTDQQFPAKIQLSPFIPFALQREKNMPHANLKREFHLANKQLARLGKSATVTVFSYPLIIQDTPQLPSPLLFDLPSYAAKPRKDNFSSTHLETYQDNYKHPWTNENLRGTTTVLANQAKCPFKAFAAHRLYAKPHLTVNHGLTPEIRGELIHKVMELLWTALKSQKNLLNLSENKLNLIIQNCIHKALGLYQEKYPQALTPLLKQLEVKRLNRLVVAAIDWEKTRLPFEVEALEQPVTVYVQNIPFNLRLDRMDKEETGEKWVIDYKTTVPTSLPWNEERPREPQLLLYTLTDEAITTATFLALKNGQMACAGLTHKNQGIAGITPLKSDKSWQDERKLWEEKVNQLALEFKEGYSLPKPINASICQHCDFLNLCRLYSTESED